MSHADFRADEVDLDRLADFTAGALEPTDALEVAALIATVPAWSRMHAALVAADVEVGSDLSAAASARIERMPADVIERINAALRAEQRHSQSVVPIASARHRSGQRAQGIKAARSRKAPKRVLAGISAAVAASVAIVVGVNVAGGLITRNSPGTTAGDAAAPAFSRETAQPTPSDLLGEGGPEIAVGGLRILASGAQYGPSTLGTFGRLAVAPGSTPPPSVPVLPTTGSTKAPIYDLPKSITDQVPPPLDRLAESGAFAECIAMIHAQHPGTVVAVDFAHYQGQPALVVLVHRPGGSSVVVAVGPQCGAQGSDEKAAVPA